MVEKAGAGLSLTGENIEAGRLAKALDSYLFDSDARGKAQAAALSLARIRRPDGSWAGSADYIAQLILERLAIISQGDDW